MSEPFHPNLPPLPLDSPCHLLPSEIEWATKQCKRLKKGSKLRLAVEAFLEHPTQVSEADVLTVLVHARDIGAFAWRKNRIALWALGRMSLTPTQKRQVTKVLAEMLKKPTLPDFAQLLGSWWFGVSVLTGLWMSATSHYDAPNLWAYIALLSMGHFLWVWLVASIWGDVHYNLLRATAVEALGLMAVPESAEPITHTMYDIACIRKWSLDKRLREAVTEALPRSLATLTPEHYQRLEPELVPNLYRLLNYVHEPLQLQILEALGRMGDGRAVQPLQRLLAKTRSHAVRDTLQRVLPILGQRLQRETAPHTLLRASSAPQEAPETLLRPLEGSHDDQPEYLLRAVNPVKSDIGEPLAVMDLGLQSSATENKSPSD